MMDTKTEKVKTKIYINPPPQDKRCEVCNRNINELKPFGKAGDPLVGDFNGAYLIKTFRSLAPRVDNERFHELVNEYSKKEPMFVGFDQALIKEFGEEKAERLQNHDQAYSTISASWECRDCAVLDTDEYFKKLSEK